MLITHSASRPSTIKIRSPPNPTAVAIGDQRQRPVLLRLDLLVPHNRRQPQIALQLHPAFQERFDRTQRRGHSPLHVGRSPSVHAVALAAGGRAGPHGNGVEMAIEHQRGAISSARDPRVEVVAPRSHFPHIDL